MLILTVWDVCYNVYVLYKIYLFILNPCCTVIKNVKRVFICVRFDWYVDFRTKKQHLQSCIIIVTVAKNITIIILLAY